MTNQTNRGPKYQIGDWVQTNCDVRAQDMLWKDWPDSEGFRPIPSCSFGKISYVFDNQLIGPQHQKYSYSFDKGEQVLHQAPVPEEFLSPLNGFTLKRRQKELAREITNYQKELKQLEEIAEEIKIA